MIAISARHRETSLSMYLGLRGKLIMLGFCLVFASFAHAGSLTVVPASPLTGPVVNGGYDSAYAPFDTTNDLAYSGNGYAKPAVAKDTLCGGCNTNHHQEYANDGNYGNGKSWISDSNNSWIEVDLGRTALVTDVLFGRDRLDQYSDRGTGEFWISVSNDGTNWTQVFDSIDYTVSGSGDSLDASFTGVDAEWVRLQVASGGAAIDELEVHGTVESAVPEPSSLLLFCTGLAMLVILHRKMALSN